MRHAALVLAAFLTASQALGSPPQGPCGTRPELGEHIQALHRYWRRSGTVSASAARSRDRDVDHVAVLRDDSDLIARGNPLDLEGESLRLTPNDAGGYDIVRLDLALAVFAGPLRLPDVGHVELDLPFEFPFFGRHHDGVFLHADGSLTFGEPDTGNAERGMGRFLTGPPRVAGYFADLDPTRGPGIAAVVTQDQAVLQWREVPGVGQVNENTFEVTLHAGGDIDLVYGTRLGTREALIGVSPGTGLDVTPADLSAAEPAGSTGALAERFAETEKVDLVAVAHRFYERHPDEFDQLVVYTTHPLNPLPGSLAFEINVSNDVQGIGLGLFDETEQWGSQGALESIVYMDSIGQYLEVDGFEVLGHEVGHRWLARALYVDRAGGTSSSLLGGGDVHWSFFLDTDASVLGGNEIEDGDNGWFETVDFARGFSALDQYAMGLRPASEVPPFFHVAQPDNFHPNLPFKPSSSSEAGVRFTGVRNEVRIEEVISAMGPRLPEADRAPKVLRQAFLLVSDDRSVATDVLIAAAARIRRGFVLWYSRATQGRGTADSEIGPAGE